MTCDTFLQRICAGWQARCLPSFPSAMSPEPRIPRDPPPLVGEVFLHNYLSSLSPLLLLPPAPTFFPFQFLFQYLVLSLYLLFSNPFISLILFPVHVLLSCINKTCAFLSLPATGCSSEPCLPLLSCHLLPSPFPICCFAHCNFLFSQVLSLPGLCAPA